MATLKAVVRGGRLVVDEPVDYPEGTELELEVLEAEDELDEQELAELKTAVEESRAEQKAGKIRPAEDLIAELRASR